MANIVEVMLKIPFSHDESELKYTGMLISVVICGLSIEKVANQIRPR